MVVSLVLALALAAPNTSHVVLSKRSGVATARALEVVAELRKRLVGGNVPVGEVEDLSKCNGKKVCLLKAGLQQNAVSMVLVEVGAVLDSAIARVEVISVEEDGRSLGVVTHEGPLRTLAEDLAGKATTVLLQPLRELHGIKDPEPLAPPPIVVVPPPPPMPAQKVDEPPSKQRAAVVGPTAPPASVETSPPAGRFFTGPRIVALSIGAIGVGTLVWALVEGVRSGGFARQRDEACGNVTPCTDRYGVANANAAALTGQSALILSIVGGGLVVTAAAIFIVDVVVNTNKPSPAISLLPVPGGAVLGFATRW